MRENGEGGVGAAKSESDKGQTRGMVSLSHGKTAKGAGLPMIFE